MTLGFAGIILTSKISQPGRFKTRFQSVDLMASRCCAAHRSHALRGAVAAGGGGIVLYAAALAETGMRLLSATIALTTTPRESVILDPPPGTLLIDLVFLDQAGLCASNHASETYGCPTTF